MLKIIKSMEELNIAQLLAVYAQSTGQNQRREDEFLSYMREDFFRQKGAFYAVWIEDDAYKSALRLEPYGDGLLLQGVETAPDDRRKGYAESLLYHVLEYLRQGGHIFVYSHVEKRNKASLGLHSKCGFRVIKDSANYIDGTITQNSCTMQIEL